MHDDVNLMTTGELASRCLSAFERISASAEDSESYVVEFSDAFVVAALALIDRLPREARIEHGLRLPFSRDELHMLKAGELTASMQHMVSERLLDWVSFGAVSVDSQRVDCARYLRGLWPFLDLFEERASAARMANYYSIDGIP